MQCRIGRNCRRSIASHIEDGPVQVSKNITDVKDRRLKIRVTINTGAAGLSGTLVPIVKTEHHGALKKFVTASGEHIRDMAEKTSPFKTSDRSRPSTKFRSAAVVKLLTSMRKGWERQHNSQARREQRCLHGHVGLPR